MLVEEKPAWLPSALHTHAIGMCAERETERESEAEMKIKEEKY